MIRPIIAIVGRPNVGKSTLFNRLVGRRQALVRDTPGVTRDRLYGRVSFERWQATVIDTGGFDPSSEEPLIEGVRRQVLAAVEEADLVLFVVDTREGPTALDLEIARILRRGSRTVVLAANKADAETQASGLADLYRLGFGDPVPVSAEHGRGVAELLEILRARGPAVPASTSRTESPVHVAVVGRPNVGKSSLVNAMVGAERVLVHEAPGTTRDAVDTTLVYEGRTYVLVDTAGIRRKGRVQEALEKLAVVMALKSLERCQVALVVVDASEAIAAQDAHIAGYANEAGRAAVIVVNKWDLVPRGMVRKAEVVEQIAVPRLRARVLHVGDAGRGYSRALRHDRAGRRRGAPPNSRWRRDGGLASRGRPAPGLVARRRADDPVRLPGRRRASDVCAESQPAQRHPLLL